MTRDYSPSPSRKTCEYCTGYYKETTEKGKKVKKFVHDMVPHPPVNSLDSKVSKTYLSNFNNDD